MAKFLILPNIPIKSPKMAPKVVVSPKTPNLFLNAVGVKLALLKPSKFQSGSNKMAGIV